LRQVECLGYDSLCNESRVAVHEQRQNFSPMLGIPTNSLSRARVSFDHGIDSFQVTRVRGKANLDLAARSKSADRAITEMIFYVAIASHQIRNVILAKFRKNDLQ
jgi:hypothetical protein